VLLRSLVLHWPGVILSQRLRRDQRKDNRADCGLDLSDVTHDVFSCSVLEQFALPDMRDRIEKGAMNRGIAWWG